MGNTGCFWKNMGNKLLLNGPPIAYKKDTFSIKYLSKFATATCHKAQQV